MRRGGFLKRTSTLRRRTALRPVSDKQRERTERLAEYRRELGHAGCEARIPDICTRWAEDLHHRLPRSLGGTDERSNLLAVCRKCHSWVEENPAQAIALGLKKRSTDA